MKTKELYLFLGSLLFPLCMSGQDPSTIVMRNTGKMAVAQSPTAGETSLYIPGAILMTGDQVSIKQNGITTLKGNFYQESTTSVFITDGAGQATTSTGSFVFAGNNSGNKRYITARPPVLATIDCGVSYIAFPNVQINTNDTIDLTEQMGMDASKITRTGTGILRLKSAASGLKVYDASLRITGTGASSTLVPAGSVIVERDLSLYRYIGASISNKDYPLFGFASPMLSMKSGYFAGNWVRKIWADNANNGHVKYVLANKSADNKTIDRDQYITDANATFDNTAAGMQTGNAYLIKARPAGFDYSQLETNGGLSVTGASASLYDKGKFVFDGKVYSMPAYNEQLFAENEVLNRTIIGSPSTTVNWVIGNSWTAPIDVAKLSALMTSSSLKFEPSIYVFPAGSTTYQRYILPGGTPFTSPLQVFDNLTSIPAMSIFMIRVLPGSPAGTFTIPKDFQVHNAVTNNLRAATTFQDEVLFRVSPEGNENIYDLTAVGMRAGADVKNDAQDIAKIFDKGNQAFQLYSLSSDNVKLSANAVPSGTKSVVLCLAPGETAAKLTITASRLESISNVWLEDLLENKLVDLKSTDTYTFASSPQDRADRFVVHFLSAPTGTDKLGTNFLQCYYNSGDVVVKGLNEGDMGSTIAIYNTQGVLVKQLNVTLTGEIRMSVNLPEGVYITKLSGKRNATVKFVKGGNI